MCGIWVTTHDYRMLHEALPAAKLHTKEIEENEIAEGVYKIRGGDVQFNF